MCQLLNIQFCYKPHIHCHNNCTRKQNAENAMTLHLRDVLERQQTWISVDRHLRVQGLLPHQSNLQSASPAAAPSDPENKTLSIFTTWRSYASTVLGVVILSVRHTHALWLIQRTHRGHLYTTWKGNPPSFLLPKISAKFQWGHPQQGRQIEVG